MSEDFCQDTFLSIKNMLGGKIDELVEVYISNARGYIEAIKEGLASGDYSKVEDAAHPLASSSSTLGALGFSNVVKKIELISEADNISDGDLLSLKEMVAGLPDYFNRVQSFLESQ